MGMLFKELSLQWIGYKKSNIKETSLSTCYRIVEKLIIKFGNYELCEFNVDIFNGYTHELLSVKKLSLKYVSNIVFVLNSILAYGYENELVPCLIRIKKTKVLKNDIKCLTDEEQVLIKEFFINNPKSKGLGIIISLLTGLRLGEICALMWNDISFENRIIRITKSMQRIRNLDKNAINKTKVIITTPKSSASIRDVPISNILYEILEKAMDSNNFDRFILTNSEQYIEPRNLEYHFKSTLKKCNINTNYKFHALRHTFATLCISRGMPIKILSVILGHENIRTTEEIYLHITNEHKLQAINDVYSYFLVDIS